MSSGLQVNYGRVRIAMAEAGRHLELKRLADVYDEHREVQARGGHICAFTTLDGNQCEWEAIGFYMTGWCCRWHTPARLAHHAEPAPACNAPVRCYCPKCAAKEAAA